jgi:hypothetical protein
MNGMETSVQGVIVFSKEDYIEMDHYKIDLGHKKLN